MMSKHASCLAALVGLLAGGASGQTYRRLAADGLWQDPANREGGVLPRDVTDSEILFANYGTARIDDATGKAPAYGQFHGLRVGYRGTEGDGAIVQSGGELTTARLWLGGDECVGTHELTGGVLNVTGRLYISEGADYAAVSGLTQTGGVANGDGLVDDRDLSWLLTFWHADVTGDADGGWAKGEFDRAGPIDDSDLSPLLANRTGSGPSPLAVPEPASLALLSLGGLLVLRKRSRR